MKFLLAIIISTLTAAPAAASGAAALGALRAAYGARPVAGDIPAPSAPAYAPVRPGLAAASSRFLGLPYVLGALGEGENGEFDRDPLISYTGLDCTTFVEQSMAFAIGGEAGAMDALRRIRYAGGVVAYGARNHFTETDWLPNNIAAGFLRDITAEVAGAGVKSEGKVISKRNWYRARTEADLRGFDWESPAARAARLARLRALGDNMDDQMVYMDYAPLADLPRLLARIPSGTVASVVRADRPDKPTLVTHQLLILDGPRGKIIRHAAQGKQVMDVDAADYIRGLAGAAWPVLGFNLAAVNAR
ncbi:MAG: N-acetylmuramoyl-L-alanine amidase-like domain-containing protein [Elusimicrobiales bacterium]